MYLKRLGSWPARLPSDHIHSVLLILSSTEGILSPNTMAKGSARRPKNVHPDPAQPAVTLAVSPSPSVSDSSDAEDISNMSELHPEGSYAVSASRPGSPAHPQFKAEELETNDVVTCQWEDCGVVFTHLPTLIAHIHNGP